VEIAGGRASLASEHHRIIGRSDASRRVRWESSVRFRHPLRGAFVLRIRSGGVRSLRSLDHRLVSVVPPGQAARGPRAAVVKKMALTLSFRRFSICGDEGCSHSAWFVHRAECARCAFAFRVPRSAFLIHAGQLLPKVERAVVRWTPHGLLGTGTGMCATECGVPGTRGGVGETPAGVAETRGRVGRTRGGVRGTRRGVHATRATTPATGATGSSGRSRGRRLRTKDAEETSSNTPCTHHTTTAE
jgi:hypothetical protein